MKKLMLIAALGVAGLMSANNSSGLINNSEKEDKQNFKVQTDRDYECYEVTYVLSCGERVVDTSCTDDDPILCDHMMIWNLLDEDLC